MLLSVAIADKPIVKMAYKWAEAPDELHIYAKWAHKLDAPAVNDIDKRSVEVKIEPESVSISAQHSTKTLQLAFPLANSVDPDGSSWTVNTFGINLVLRKSELQTVWGALLPVAVPVPKNCHHWWEMKTKFEAEMKAVKKNGAPRETAAAAVPLEKKSGKTKKEKKAAKKKPSGEAAASAASVEKESSKTKKKKKAGKKKKTAKTKEVGDSEL
mmetsp:Transcript_199/g.339  ORF Transcript_199/g.339 Transcript_199/m.339 type:complete len:213 (+) Transcript_199:2-640(+)